MTETAPHFVFLRSLALACMQLALELSLIHFSIFSFSLAMATEDNSKIKGTGYSKRRPCRPTIMVSAIKAWASQEKNGLKDFVLVRVRRVGIVSGLHRTGIVGSLLGYSRSYHSFQAIETQSLLNSLHPLFLLSSVRRNVKQPQSWPQPTLATSGNQPTPEMTTMPHLCSGSSISFWRWVPL